MEAQYSAFWISKVLLPASHIVMFGLDGLTPSQTKDFLQLVFAQAQGVPTNSNATLCGFSIQAATDIFLDLQQSSQNFQRFVSGSPLIFFLFLLLMCQYEKTAESRAMGSRESNVTRSRKFISCLQASLFSLPSSENLKSSSVKGSFYTLMTSLSQRNFLAGLDTLTVYPSNALNTTRSKQVIKSFFDDARLPNANDYFPPKVIEIQATIPTTQPIPANTIPANTIPTNTIPTNTIPTNTIPTNTIPSRPSADPMIPSIQISRPNVNLNIPSVLVPDSPILPPTRVDVDSIEQASIPSSQASIPSSQASIPSSQAPIPSSQAPVPSSQAPAPSSQAKTNQRSNKADAQVKGLSNPTLLKISLATLGVAIAGYWVYQKAKK